MAGDIATLGLAVESSQVKTATGDLRAFNAEAQRAPGPIGAIEAAARRAGVSVEEFKKRMSAAGQNVAAYEAATAKARGQTEKHEEAMRRAAKAAALQNQKFEAMTRVANILPGPLGDIVRSTGALSNGVSRLSVGLTAGVVGMGAIVAATAAAIAQYAEFEAHQAKVTNAISATGGASRQTADTIEKYVQALSQSGTQSTDTIRASSAELLKFRGVAGSTFPRVMELAQDLAATGFTDLKGATTALGKAMQDPTEAAKELESVGLRLTAAQQSLAEQFMRTGQASKAQRVILDAVAAQVGGSDVRAADTLSAAWGRLANAGQQTLETYGKQVTEATGLIAIIQKLAQAVETYNKVKAAGGSLNYFAMPIVGGAAPEDKPASFSQRFQNFAAPGDALEDWGKKQTAIAGVNKALADAARTASLLPAQLEIYNMQVKAGVAGTDSLGRAMLGTSAAAQSIALAQMLDAGMQQVDSVEEITPIDLLHLMEVARRELFDGKDGSGFHAIGGYALYTVVDASGVMQKRIHEWPEDRVGEKITPRPIDWKAWRAARIAEQVAAVAPAGVSKLRRSMMAKKAAKGKLRIVA